MYIFNCNLITIEISAKIYFNSRIVIILETHIEFQDIFFNTKKFYHDFFIKIRIISFYLFIINFFYISKCIAYDKLNFIFSENIQMKI